MIIVLSANIFKTQRGVCTLCLHNFDGRLRHVPCIPLESSSRPRWKKLRTARVWRGEGYAFCYVDGRSARNVSLVRDVCSLHCETVTVCACTWRSNDLAHGTANATLCTTAGAAPRSFYQNEPELLARQL
jgi:hypothetical protein